MAVYSMTGNADLITGAAATAAVPSVTVEPEFPSLGSVSGIGVSDVGVMMPTPVTVPVNSSGEFVIMLTDSASTIVQNAGDPGVVYKFLFDPDDSTIYAETGMPSQNATLHVELAKEGGQAGTPGGDTAALNAEVAARKAADQAILNSRPEFTTQLTVFPPGVETSADILRSFRVVLGESIRVPAATRKIAVFAQNRGRDTSDEIGQPVAWDARLPPQSFAFTITQPDVSAVGLRAADVGLNMALSFLDGNNQVIGDKEVPFAIGIGAEYAVAGGDGGGDVTTAQLTAETNARIAGDVPTTYEITSQGSLDIALGRHASDGHPSIFTFDTSFGTYKAGERYLIGPSFSTENRLVLISEPDGVAQAAAKAAQDDADANDTRLDAIEKNGWVTSPRLSADLAVIVSEMRVSPVVRTAIAGEYRIAFNDPGVIGSAFYRVDFNGVTVQARKAWDSPSSITITPTQDQVTRITAADADEVAVSVIFTSATRAALGSHTIPVSIIAESGDGGSPEPARAISGGLSTINAGQFTDLAITEDIEPDGRYYALMSRDQTGGSRMETTSFKGSELLAQPLSGGGTFTRNTDENTVAVLIPRVEDNGAQVMNIGRKSARVLNIRIGQNNAYDLVALMKRETGGPKGDKGPKGDPGGLTQAQVDARISSYARATPSGRMAAAQLPATVVQGGTEVLTIDSITQAAYDALTSKSATTLYLITG